MRFLQKYIHELSEILQLILFMAVPTLLLLVYTHQYVTIALIKRKTQQLINVKKEFQSRNQALKTALGKLAHENSLPYWQSYQEVAPYQKNKIIRIKLPPLPAVQNIMGATGVEPVTSTMSR